MAAMKLGLGLFATLFSSSGRLTRGPFVLAILAVYVLGFASQALISGRLAQQGGLWAFVVAQAILLWAWHTLHANRLRDAGRGIGSATGIAVVYGLSVVLLILLLWFLGTPSSNGPTGTNADSLLAGMLLLYLLALLYGAVNLGSFGIVIWALVLIALAPIVLAIGFSIWAATLPSAAPAVPSAPAP